MTDTADFFRSRLDGMVDHKHPLVVLSRRLPWAGIEQTLAPRFAPTVRPGQKMLTRELLGAHEVEFGSGLTKAGRPRLSIRLMASLQYLKHAFNLSDEELLQRWSENVVYQFFSGVEYDEARLPCDATQIGRFRRPVGEEGLEQLLKASIEKVVEIRAIKPSELERVIVDTTVQEGAIAHPVDSRLLEIARHKVVSSAQKLGISLKQTFAAETKDLRRKAGGYAHAKQFKRLKKAVKRQRTILGVVMRAIAAQAAKDAKAFFFDLIRLSLWGRVSAVGQWQLFKRAMSLPFVSWRQRVGPRIGGAASFFSHRLA
jgi:transposase, IS5 family